jgi:hypothetical protein
MDKYINGESVDRDKKKCAERFLSVSENDLTTLKLRAIVRDANIYKYLVTKSDGFIYHLSSSTMLGKTSSDVVEFLKNPLNQDVADSIINKVEQHWK